MSQEIWKDVPGYEGLYQVSTLGRVQRDGSIIKSRVSPQGYIVVTLCKDAIRSTKQVHRLVAEAFLPNPNNLPCACHIDDNRSNPVVDNLFWGTYQDNSTDMARKGRTPTKLTEDQVITIRSLYDTGEHSIRSLTRTYQVTHDCISNIVKGRRWKHLLP